MPQGVQEQLQKAQDTAEEGSLRKEGTSSQVWQKGSTQAPEGTRGCLTPGWAPAPQPKVGAGSLQGNLSIATTTLVAATSEPR